MAFQKKLQFIDPPLDKEDVKKFRDLKKNPDWSAVLDWLSRAVDNGSKFGLSYEEYHRTFKAHLIAGERSDFHGLCLTARNDDPLTALLLLYYRDTVICAHGWPFPEEKRGHGDNQY